MDVTDLLDDALSRIPEAVHEAAAGLDDAALRWRAGPEANPIGWLVWHIARVEDAQVPPLLGAEQLWHADGWEERIQLPDGANDLGYGWTTGQVGAFEPPGADVLLAYLDAVSDRCRRLVRGVTREDLDRVEDESYDPPVTVGVRLVSVVDDAAQHAGQAGYVRGLLDATST